MPDSVRAQYVTLLPKMDGDQVAELLHADDWWLADGVVGYWMNRGHGPAMASLGEHWLECDEGPISACENTRCEVAVHFFVGAA